ncbi:MAG: cell division protein ZapA [Gammaproteobacteria bacterium]|nr:cell division protein ZapA [Rhodocyclaceae bacterium]MBU3909312.1 cell division protein ZapA [Gammaproteobacteria bacterium]MBU4005528.1 cell division protein ZapA [Gammaproteobacteria bacterium]MBU4020919.1 cell division protein ZapA [Gammaproteobacteria bacterium]MBU4096738.1 cell division protein ZapA [Gammaproteobacteria bacterium]
MSSTLDIKLQGREYRVACAPEEFDTLSAAAVLLDARMGEAARTTRSTGERLAVVAALNLAYELNALRQTGQSGAIPSSSAALSAEKAIDAEDLRRRIKNMEARLDEALARQDELF